MKPGPRPKPFELKQSEGFPGHRKHFPSVQVPMTRFEPPMKLTGLARREWNRVLRVAFWLRETEAAAIADRCLCVQRISEAESLVRELGFTIKGARGEVSNPAVRIARAYRGALQRWDSELGLLPSSRPAISSGESRGRMDAVEEALCSGRLMDPIEADLCGDARTLARYREKSGVMNL